MARTSRLPHPPGGHFVIAHAWAVKAVGKNAALVLGELDFLDRAQPLPGQPLTTRAGLIDALQGLVGRNAVDEAVKTLVGLGWVVLIERQTVGSNIRTWHEFALNAQAVSEWIENRESRRPDLGKAGVPESGPEPGPKPGPESGRPINKEEEKEAESKPAPAADAKEPENINPQAPQGRGRSCRSAALVGQGDDAAALAERIEQLVEAGRKAGGDEARDKSGAAQLQALAQHVPAAKILDAIACARWVSEAIKAAQAAGLGQAAAMAKAEAAARAREAAQEQQHRQIYTQDIAQALAARGQEFLARVKQKKGVAHA